ncbi:MAG: hypothetical protein U1E78_02775 [Gammaproteobacteria bacterium]
MQRKKIIISASLLCVSIILTGFTNLSKPIDSPRQPIPGNPDPEAGIVVRFDSTAEDILADSSQNIKFNVSLLYGTTKIRYLDIDLFDQNPKRFRIIDDACGFIADESYYASVSFDKNKENWYGLYFAPFLPGFPKTESEIRPILDKWIYFFTKNGWKSRTSESEMSELEPYQFPKNGIPDRSVYQTLSCNGHKLVMLVHPGQNNTFYIRVFIENYSLFDDKVQK